MISGDVPKHLVVQARTGFLTTAAPAVPSFAPIATMIPMTSKNIELVDLGAAPMPTQNIGRPKIGDFIEKNLAVAAKDWDITVFISYNAVKDDQTGSLDRKVRAAGDNFQRHISQQAFKALNDGEAATNFGNAYDGLPFFSNSHVDPGAFYTTVQDNLGGAVTLDQAGLESIRGIARRFLDDQGEPTEHTYNTLIVSPELEGAAWRLTNVRGGSDDPTNANPFAGSMNYIVSSKLDSTAWILVASGETIKPIIIAMRETPNLQSAWFDPNAPDGGRYYFKFYARYAHFYGDWRLAYMGHT